MGSENITGAMAAISKDSSNQGLERVKASGNVTMEPAINIKANTIKIESKATVYLHGLLVMFIKAIIKTI